MRFVPGCHGGRVLSTPCGRHVAPGCPLVDGADFSHLTKTISARFLHHAFRPSQLINILWGDILRLLMPHLNFIHEF